MDGYNLFGALLFGTIGMTGFIIGKKRSDAKLMIIGVVLMGYPYLVPSTLILYIAGVLLTAALFIWR